MSKEAQIIPRCQTFTKPVKERTMTVVNKLGGSCLRSIEDYRKIPEIIQNTPCVLILSATYGTTDTLFECL